MESIIIDEILVQFGANSDVVPEGTSWILLPTTTFQ
jgi:hypothetical protein